MFDNDEIKKPIVLDIGTKNIKGGFAGCISPSLCFPSVVGVPRHTRDMAGLALQEYYVGDQAQNKRGILTMKYYSTCSKELNFDFMDKLLQYTLSDELAINSEEHPILFTHAPFVSRQYQEKLTQLMFESFSVPAMYTIMDSVSSLFASGRTTGTTIKFGHTESYTTPIYEGYALPHAISRLDLGGFDLTISYHIHLADYNSRRSGIQEDIENLKEKLGYIALDFDRELKLAQEGPLSFDESYELPSGQLLVVHQSTRFSSIEPIFQPSFIGLKDVGIHRSANDSIMLCDKDIRKTLYKNIVLSGASTMFPGFTERITKEIASLSAPNNFEVNVVSPENRDYSSWIGGSIVTSLNTFHQMSISSAEYDEYGPRIVHRKCFT